MTHSNLLSVRVVALAFQAGGAARDAFQLALNLSPSPHCWALAPPDHASQIRAAWPEGAHTALMVAHVPPPDAVEAACAILAELPPGPVAVLLANAPPAKGIDAVLRRNPAAALARRLRATRPDVQVHIHRPDWLRRPPRLM